MTRPIIVTMTGTVEAAGTMDIIIIVMAAADGTAGITADMAAGTAGGMEVMEAVIQAVVIQAAAEIKHNHRVH